MRIWRAAALAACLAGALAGCKTASDLLEGQKVDYKSAGSLPPLVPATVVS